MTEIELISVAFTFSAIAMFAVGFTIGRYYERWEWNTWTDTTLKPYLKELRRKRPLVLEPITELVTNQDYVSITDEG